MMNLFENLQVMKEANNFDLDELIDVALSEADSIDVSNAEEDINMCRDQLEAMADGGNDPYVDAVCDFIIQKYKSDFSEDDVWNHRDEIEKALIEYAKDTLSNFELSFSSYIEEQEDDYYDEDDEEDYDELDENTKSLKESQELYKLPYEVQVAILSEFDSDKPIYQADGTDSIQWGIESAIWQAIDHINTTNEELVISISKRKKTPIDDEGNLL